MKFLIFLFFLFSSATYADMVQMSSQNITQSSLKFGNLKKYYESTNVDKSVLDNSDKEVIVMDYFYTGFEEFDNLKLDLLENGYVLIGYSLFKNKKLSNKTIQNYAKEIGASIAVVMAEGLIEREDSEIDDLRDIYSEYFYAVSFWQKTNFWKASNMLGIRMEGIPRDKKSLYQRNTGVYINSVVKGTPAYNSNILIGDVIIAINGFDTLSPESFSSIKDTELSKVKTLNLTLLRVVNGTVKEVQLPVIFN